MKIINGLSPHHRADAAKLYWQAFRGTLHRVFGPDRLAIAYLARIMSANHCLSVVNDRGELVGFAGFQSDRGRLTPFDPTALRRVYGRLGAGWRMVLTRFAPWEIDNQRFLIDGICVAPAWQGQGIGQSLISALEEQARARGYGEMRLEVMPQNTGARRLYERLGFRVLHREKRSVAGWALGLGRALVMVRQI